jgi:predicted ATPase
VEAIAEAFGLDPFGGRASARFGRPDSITSPLGEALRLETTPAGARMRSGPRLKKQGFFLRAETAFGMTEQLGGMYGYWEADTSTMSHGEAYLTMIATMMDKPGFYVMDEPESALSFTASLHLVTVMHQLARTGAQVVCATHSPILAATPDADIVEVNGNGLRRTSWTELELVERWRGFLTRPDLYLRELLYNEES